VAVALAHINRQPPPLPATVPPAVRLLIERALAKDPADRFADGAAFAAAVRSVASGNGLAPASAPGAATTPPYPRGAATAQTEVVDDLADSRTQVLGAASAGGAAVPGARTSAGAMPPLRRSGDDDEDGRYAAPPPDDDRRRRPWVWLVAGLLLLALLGGGVWALTRGGDGASTNDAAPTTSAPASSAPGAETAFVDSASYIGEPVDDVEQALTDKGLQVVTEEATAAQLAELGQALDAGDVVTTDPFAQEVPLDSTVTLYYAADDFAPGTGDEDPGDTGNQDQPEAPAAPTTQAPQRPTAPAPTTPRGNATTSSAPAPSTSASAATTPNQPADEDEGVEEQQGTPVPEPELPAEPAPDGRQGNAQGREQVAPDADPAA
jgi:eukaryotic-like serine/threonine-protein kinase